MGIRLSAKSAWVLGCMLAAGLSMPAHGGAWGKSPGELEIISATNWTHASEGYDDLGIANALVQLDKYETAAYAEYGLRPGWTLVGRVALQDVSLQRDTSLDQASGLAASYAGIRRQVLDRGKWVAALQLGAYLPGSVENGLDLRLGQGGVEPEFRALAGRNFKLAGHDWFVDMQLARRFRSEDLANEWHASATLGMNAGKRQMWMLETFHAQSDAPLSPRGRYLRQTKMRGSLVWRLSSDRRIQVYAETAVAGRNTVAEHSIGMGFWQSFR